MKWKYVRIAILIGSILYLVTTNPEEEAYTTWAAKQFVKRTDANQVMEETAKDKDSILGDLATFGKKITEKYIEPQVGALIKSHTKKNNYLILSTYETKFVLGSREYTYKTVGMANHFFLIEWPK